MRVVQRGWGRITSVAIAAALGEVATAAKNVARRADLGSRTPVARAVHRGVAPGVTDRRDLGRGGRDRGVNPLASTLHALVRRARAGDPFHDVTAVQGGHVPLEHEGVAVGAAAKLVREVRVQTHSVLGLEVPPEVGELGPATVGPAFHHVVEVAAIGFQRGMLAASATTGC